MATEKTIEINGVSYPVYATVEDADAYFSTVFNSNWADISEDDKKKLLVSATREIDRGSWKGTKKEENQPLQFPRIIAGKETSEDVLTMACCEEAAAIYTSGSVVGADTNGIKSMKVQDTEIEFLDNRTEKMYQSDAAYDLLKPYKKKSTRVLY